MIVLALVVVGAAAYARLGVDRFPAVDLPTVSVRTELPGASAEEVETQVSPARSRRPSTPSRASTSCARSPGPSQSIVIVDVRARAATSTSPRRTCATASRRRSANLPRDAEPPIVAKFDNDQSPVLTVALSGDRPLRELTEIADKIVKVQLERSTASARCASSAGSNRAINVWVDADRLAAYELPITAVRDAIVRQNAEVPGGNVTAGTRESVAAHAGPHRRPARRSTTS